MRRIQISAVFLILLAIGMSDPAHARKWTDKSGKYSVDADFVSLTDGKVVVKKSDGQLVPPIPLEKLSDTDQEVARALAQAQAAAPAPSKPPAAVAPAKQSSPIANPAHFIEAGGQGETPDDALKDAFRAAVRRAVGAYVDEESLLENDEVIQDKVLTHSRGCIESYATVSQKTEDGVTCVTIRAFVKPDVVAGYLRQANVGMSELPGDQFWAKITSLRQEEKDAESLLRKALNGFPQNCLKAETIGAPREDHNENVTQLAVKVRIAVDQEAFATFSKELQRVLDQIARRKLPHETALAFQTDQYSGQGALQWEPKATVSTSVRPTTQKFILALVGAEPPKTPHSSTSSKAHSSIAPRKRGSSLPARTVPAKSSSARADIGDGIVFALNTEVAKSGTRTRWKCYVLDKHLRALLTETASRKVSCQVLLVDESGSKIAAQDAFAEAETIRRTAPPVYLCQRARRNTKTRSTAAPPLTLLGSYWGEPGATDLAESTQRAPQRTGELKVLLVSQMLFATARPITEQLPELTHVCHFDLTDAELRRVKRAQCMISPVAAAESSTRSAIGRRRY